MMPGGHPEAWPHIKPIFQAIAARVNDKEVACDWVGDEGSGHFIKMIHNGIEYGDIQLICEAYHLMREVLGMTAHEIGEVFAKWNTGALDSYLIEITSKILHTIDDETGKPVVDQILDVAGQKGTGRWTVADALELGQPITLIAEAVFARNISSMKDERVVASKTLAGVDGKVAIERDVFIQHLHDALLASKIVSYAQGFEMIEAAGKANNWSLNKGAVALMWRAGCIIRSSFLGKIRDAFENDTQLVNLMLDPWFTEKLAGCQAGWRQVVSSAALTGIPAPAFASALSYYDSYRSEHLPANLLQAQRDFFGAHTYERIDRPRNEFFHTNWTGEGGTTTASTYNA